MGVALRANDGEAINSAGQAVRVRPEPKSLSVGPAATFLASNTFVPSVAVMSPTLAIVAFSDAGAFELKVMPLTISGDTVTPVTEDTVSMGVDSITYFSPLLVKIDSTRVILISYSVNSIKARCLTITGTSIAVGPTASISGFPRGADAFSSSHLLLYYVDSFFFDPGYFRCLEVSGDVVTFGAELESTVLLGRTSITALTDSTALAIYGRDIGYKDYRLKAMVIGRSGTTPVPDYDGETEIYDLTTSYLTPSSTKISETSVMTVYRHNTTPESQANIIRVINNVITVKPVSNSISYEEGILANLNNIDHIIALFDSDEKISLGKARKNAETVTLYNGIAGSSNATGNYSLKELDSTSAIMVYTEETSPGSLIYYGKARKVYLT